MVPCVVNIYYNKPTRCSCSQSILFHCRFSLQVSGAFHTHHQEYIKLHLQPPVQVILSLQLLSSSVAKFGLGQSRLAGSLYMFRVLCTPIIRSTLNCIYSLRYRSAKLVTLEEGSCNDNMTCTGGCRYSLMYSWWWVCKAPETCRVTLQVWTGQCKLGHFGRR